MSLFALLTRQNLRRRRPSPQAYGFRPRLEVLEGRALPSTLTVTNASDTGVSGDGSLRGEIAAAAPSGDRIVFAHNLEGQTITLTHGELAINKSLVIHGPGADDGDDEGPAPNAVTISANNNFRVFGITSSSATVTLFGLTITNGQAYVYGGHAGDGGGGIRNSGTLTVSHCTLSGNSATAGGGAIFNDGTLTVSHSTLSGNSVNYLGFGLPLGGGGIFNNNYGTLTVSHSTLSGNSATAAEFGGGGILNSYYGTLTVSSSTLSGNSASS
ncbi:MAG TPA: hypothetical protein VG013_21440, partial [Gemmataceae bacterium]|nr:hypothetical protein [Gemmataceae bacterium]